MSRQVLITAAILCGIALLGAPCGAQGISVDVNLYGRIDHYCLGSDELEFGVSNNSQWEPLAFCFFQERTAAGVWTDLIEVDASGILVAPYWASRLSANPLPHAGATTLVPVPENLLVPDGRKGTFRLFCGFLEAEFEGADPDSGRTLDDVRSDTLEQLRAVSFEDLIDRSEHRYSREFSVLHCEP
ncbi:MAG: hypothetical protein KAJ97_03240 [Acidobacteria bacterium]|nr:hypothetical protein [Acidobacteriota bacterium]